MSNLEKLEEAIKRLFEPWQDRDKVRAEVQAARVRIPQIAITISANQPTKREDETQLEWQTRGDGK
ncbi:hypothetical protein LCGC14_2328980 [marine sediment metagenome]|uniref:Uncharacterized protein n=1 Tax=marine sediment metagenome TaxID=412755 RepID=A0A0F9CG40_9ZZZZ